MQLDGRILSSITGSYVEARSTSASFPEHVVCVDVVKLDLVAQSGLDRDFQACLCSTQS